MRCPLQKQVLGPSLPLHEWEILGEGDVAIEVAPSGVREPGLMGNVTPRPCPEAVRRGRSRR